MSINLNFDDKVLYKKLSEYFGDNIKYSLKTEHKLFIITKSDIFYEIDITNLKPSYFILYDNKEIIESMIVKDLCNKGVNDLICGKLHCIALTNDNKFYFNGVNESEVEKVLNDLNISDVKCGSYHALFLTSSG
jgi:alpha-tubulin suppressor-like RCC1 family protein